MAKAWFDVTVSESYHHTYKVLAGDEREADDLVNELINNGNVNPTKDGSQSYGRKTDVECSEHPDKGGEYWEVGDKNEIGRAEHKYYRGPICTAPLYIACGYAVNNGPNTRDGCSLADKCPWKKEET